METKDEKKNAEKGGLEGKEKNKNLKKKEEEKKRRREENLSIY